VQAFEFGTVLDSRGEGNGRRLYQGWWRTGPRVHGFAVYRTPNGTQQVVALVGADPNVGKRFPVPNMAESAGATSPEAVLYDVSDRKTNGSHVTAGRSRNQSSPCEHRGARLKVRSFLGCPFSVTSYRNATRYMGFGPQDAMYILLRVGNGYSVSDVQQTLDNGCLRLTY